ncbi:DUF429 domain-containing protein [Variovorax sp. J22G73]|jgi:hypothetical protein|uniref:DUF429 domain-containing protein n=1 Tax=unclassified Variovorax TaxID=663243 RepID=UPI000D5F62BE|nr:MULTISPECIES: DUF429 domain-containing protein [unclassified Variovorax]MDM0007379.1 DUF429 domain-containing protein [Variovorax sp. J22R203]MDM0098869.1 DUF429 domain-containing protein [Variovorax sp. J22G73]
MALLGCDFSSAPTRRKPIVVALGELVGARRVRLTGLQRFSTLDAWGDWLCATPSWVGGFDFPFSLPRELVEHLGWPVQWAPLMAHYAGLSRAEIRNTFAAFCAARPVGGKFAHRAADLPAGSSPSMKWVNPPVAYMLHAGVPRLLAAGARIPGLHEGDGANRIALEAYPGLLARELIARRSYKSDDLAKQTPERLAARTDLLAALEGGDSRLGLGLDITGAQRGELLADARGDDIDAVMCLLQAAWGSLRAGSVGPGYGLPERFDPLEGWIVTA